MLGQGESAAAGDKTRSPLVSNTTTEGFRNDVLTQSARQPVLVDFWAPWCGPCKQLGSVLEKIAKAADGKIRVVKMNIEEHPEIAGQLGIQSIPAVVAFQKGQPIDGFAGALPESQVKGFVERLVGPIGGEIDDLIAAADAAFGADDMPAAAEMYAAALAFDETDPRAVSGLARAQISMGDLDQAEATLGAHNGAEDKGGLIAAVRATLDLARQAENVGDFSGLEREIEDNPGNFQARFDLAVALNAAGKRNEAADSLIEIIRRNRAWNDEAARKQLLQLFEAWGPMEPETIAARRKLSVLLYS